MPSSWLVSMLCTFVVLSGCISELKGDESADEGTAPPSDDDSQDGPPPGEPPPPEPEEEPEEEVEEPPPPVPFEFTGDNCAEFLVQVPTDVAVLRESVPANFTLLGEASGRGVAFVGYKECDFAVEDGTASRGFTADIGVFIEAPDGTDGFHYYQVLWLTSDVELWARVENAGFVGAYVPAESVEAVLASPTPLPAGMYSAEVAWDQGGYGSSANAAAPPGLPDAIAIGWHEGAHGLLRLEKLFTYAGFGGGTGEVHAEAGSPVAELFGAESGEGAALYNQYDHTGAVELAP